MPRPSIVPFAVVAAALAGLLCARCGTLHATAEDQGAPCSVLAAECPHCSDPQAKQSCQTAVTANDEVQCTAVLDNAQVTAACAPEAGASDAGAETSLPACDPGEASAATPCACASPCTTGCPAGKCSVTCQGDACAPTCAGGGCTIVCAAGATCTASCAGGGCTFVCQAGSTCTESCEGGACTFACQPDSVCSESCAADAGCTFGF